MTSSTTTSEQATAGSVWGKQVVEHFVAAQKAWLDLAAQQNELALKAIAEGSLFYRTAPNPALAEWAQQAATQYAAAQQRWLTLATQLTFGRTPDQQ